MPLLLIVKQEGQPEAATVARSLKAISSSTAADEWSWDHELIRPFSDADSPIICLAVCVELDSNITAMINRDSDAILLPEETPDIPSGKILLKFAVA
jgi:hypothetical protein